MFADVFVVQMTRVIKTLRPYRLESRHAPNSNIAIRLRYLAHAYFLLLVSVYNRNFAGFVCAHENAYFLEIRKIQTIHQ